MSTLGVILCIALLAAVLAGGFFAWRRTSSSNGAERHEMMREFQAQMQELQTSVNKQILDLTRNLNDHQKFNSKLLQDTHHDYQNAMGQVHSKLGELNTATKTMVDIGKDISSLQDILRSPKLRGGLGELFLSDLLEQILPKEHFELQYGFKDGAIVDAVIKLGEGIVPVDAKFPLENFQKMLHSQDEAQTKTAQKAFYTDVKKHIDAIASKYILPNEGTLDFAIMYIPAENVYYEIMIKSEEVSESIGAYAMKKKIVPVSPNSFYGYLQAIVRGLKGMRIEKSAQRILESLGQLEADLNRISVDFEKIGGHLSNAQSAYERTTRGFDKMRNKLTMIEGNQADKVLEES